MRPLLTDAEKDEIVFMRATLYDMYSHPELDPIFTENAIASYMLIKSDSIYYKTAQERIKELLTHRPYADLVQLRKIWRARRFHDKAQLLRTIKLLATKVTTAEHATDLMRCEAEQILQAAKHFCTGQA